MKRMTSVLLIILSLLMVASAMTVGVGASSAYQTYTYSIEGEALYSPDAYTAIKTIDSLQMGLSKTLEKPSDLVVGKDQKVYIADKGNSRVVVLDRYYKFEREIATFYNGNTDDELKDCEGVFVTEDSIWVCDTGNTRLVEFDLQGNFKRIVKEPEIEITDENSTYSPIAMAIDQYGRIYVASRSTTEGIIVMDSTGQFVGFIGAQAVTLSAWELMWRRFQTEEQKDAVASNLPVTYNNIAITPEGFVYATLEFREKEEISAAESAITSKSKDGKYMPVKLLNPAGDEIMRRNGFWPPAGEVDFKTVGMQENVGMSAIIDVAVGPERTWSIIDKYRSKIYTYDFNGNLLFAFGDSGEKGDILGTIYGIRAIAYQDDTMLILDDTKKSIVVYNRTEYGDLLIDAIAAENSLDYTYAIDCWEKVLQRNSNFDAAYVGIGNALYRSGKYSESLVYYETAYDTENWSNSYKEVRKEWMSDYFIIMVLAIVLVIVVVIKFFGYAGKVNKRAATDGKARKTFKEELLFGFHVIFHPFDGFYDLKHEHRGSVRAAIVFVALTVLSFFYQSIGTGYVMNPTGTTSTVWAQAISVVVPLMLFVLANWCLTTLFEGEGSFKDIFIASSYSLLPLILLNVPATICSNWVTTTEATLVTFVYTAAFLWAFLLLFFGTMITHDYSMGKNFVTILGTIVAMAFIVFIVLLFTTLLGKLVSLVTGVVTQLQNRV